jgi:RecA-family ATPase
VNNSETADKNRDLDGEFPNTTQPNKVFETFRVRTPEQLKQRAADLGSAQYVIDKLIPSQSLSLCVGDSGLGKSPLLYQAAICVAVGQPFLGLPTMQGPVLYMDSENGIAQVSGLIEQISTYLGLQKPPEELLLWNLNDAPADFSTPGCGFRAM